MHGTMLYGVLLGPSVLVLRSSLQMRNHGNIFTSVWAIFLAVVFSIFLKSCSQLHENTVYLQRFDLFTDTPAFFLQLSRWHHFCGALNMTCSVITRSSTLNFLQTIVICLDVLLHGFLHLLGPPFIVMSFIV